jgi:hypothetical protein
MKAARLRLNGSRKSEGVFMTILRKVYKFLIPSPLRHRIWKMKEYLRWKKRLFDAPAPFYVKKCVLLRNGTPNATWVETGTFMADMTVFLAEHSQKVISVEPEPEFFSKAQQKCKSFDNIKIINGLSEKVLPEILPSLNGAVNFWLDGHYSGGVTFKGPIDTPIIEELWCIEKSIKNISRLAVLIDDMRCFNSGFPGYPEKSYLVVWAEKNKLHWHIEHDIFVARNF